MTTGRHDTYVSAASVILSKYYKHNDLWINLCLNIKSPSKTSGDQWIRDFMLHFFKFFHKTTNWVQVTRRLIVESKTIVGVTEKSSLHIDHSTVVDVKIVCYHNTVTQGPEGRKI